LAGELAGAEGAEDDASAGVDTGADVESDDDVGVLSDLLSAVSLEPDFAEA
jgi:hypothetical protein